MRKMMKELAIALLIFSMVFGTVYAALTMFGQVTTIIGGTKQAVLVDGLAMPEAGAISETIDTVAGGDVIWRHHWLKSQTTELITVPIVTTISPEESAITVSYTTAMFQTEGEGVAEWSAEIITSGSYSAKLTVPAGGISNAARVVMKSPVVIVNDISSVSVDYYLTGDRTTDSSPYIILELDSDGDGVKDDWAVSWQDDDVGTGTWLTHAPTGSVWHVVSIAGSQQSPLTLEELKVKIGDKTILNVKVAVGEWGMTGKTSAYVDNLTINDKIYDLEVLTSPFILEAGERLDFYICYEFATDLPNSDAGYTITTDFLVPS